MPNSEKPHRGSIVHAEKRYVDGCPGLGYYIVGRFVDHPDFAGRIGHTSYVVAHNTETGEIETRNSRYTLV